MERSQFISVYWSYYLVLERKFIESLQYVELNEVNKNCFSLEFVNKIQTICSEVDVLMKQICGIEMNSESNMGQYKNIILQKYQDIEEKIIKIQGKDMELKPFENFSQSNKDNPLFWWDAYNSVKHGRGDIVNFKKANLFNVVNALAGLYLLEIYYLRELAAENNSKDSPDEDSKLFSIKGWEWRIQNLSGMCFRKL